MSTQTAQISLFPFVEIKPEQVGSKHVAEKTSAKKAGGIYKVPLDNIRVRAGFNVRDEIVPEILENKITSLLENGQISPGIADLIGTMESVEAGDYFYSLVDGHYRFFALLALVERGHEGFDHMKLVINPKSTTEKDRLLQMCNTQNSVPFTPNEWAKMFNLLKISGLSQVEIANHCEKTPAYVSQMLSYFKEDQDVKDLVIKGKIAAGTIVKLQKEIPDQEERKLAIYKAAGIPYSVIHSMAAIHSPSTNGSTHDQLKQEVKEWDERMNGKDGDANDDDGELEEKQWEELTKDGKHNDVTGDSEGAVNRNGNYVSSAREDIDTTENTSWLASYEVKRPKTISLKNIVATKTKRERAELLAKELIKDYKINILVDPKEDDYIALINLISYYLN